MRLRMLVLLLLFTIGVGGILVFRLFQLQLTEEGKENQRRAVDQQMSAITIPASRGQIMDTNGKTLAVSATVWNVIVDPSNVRDGEAEIISEGLSQILGVDKETIRKKCLKENSQHEFIKKRIEKPVYDQIINFITQYNINAIHMKEDTKRYYPYGSLASTVIGFVNSENIGGTGIESQYNKVLSGTPGMVVSAKTALNTDMPFRYQQMYEAQNGNSLVLTIDETIQHFLEKHLETAVMEHNIKNRAVGIVMDVNTGAILAMSTKPDFDPNNYLEITDPAAVERLNEVAIRTGGTDNDEYLEAKSNEQNLQWRNKAISDPYEPGSVFKIVTASAALDHGDVGLENYFDCYGSFEVAGEKIGCWKTAGHGNQSFGEAIKHSCNPAFIQIGQRLGGDAFFDYFEAFGLTEGTDIDLPGEAGNKGLYYEKDMLVGHPVELASCSFGQSNKVTPIQMITAVCAAVNGGNLVTPYVVKQVVDDSGSVVESHEPQVRRQVISQETSETMCELLEHVVSDSDGSGRNCYIAGYRIAGKTGTSQKLDQKPTEDGQVAQEEHILSFVGIAPADDPQIAVLVILDTPEISNVLGSTIAAPVVKYIMEDTLPYLGIEPKYTAEELENLDVTAPNIMGKSVEDAKALAAEKELTIKFVGSGDKVLKQVPTPSTPIPRDATIIAYTDNEVKPEMVEVPDVFGLGTSLVNQAITNAGLNLRLTGGKGYASVASRQSPAAGTQVEVGTVVTVELTATDVE